MTEVRVFNDAVEYWEYCCGAFGYGCWKKKIALMGTSATYIFDHPEDATAFKLKFQL